MSVFPLIFDEFHRTEPAAHKTWSLFSPEELACPMKTMSSVLHQLAQIEKDTSISQQKDHFQVSIDVQQFAPEEIRVKLTPDNTVTVEAKHEEKQDEHGFISRQFLRRYVLPKDCDVKRLQSKLSSDGVLTLSATKKAEGKELQHKEIPIILTRPVKVLEPKPKI